MNETAQTIRQERAENTRSIQIIAGVNPVTQDICDFVRADSWAINSQIDLNKCRTWGETL